MDASNGYKDWLRCRGIEHPSDDEVKLFERRAKANPRGSLLEFLAYMWMDSEVKYSGTRRWLGLQGLLDPSVDDLRYFNQKIKRTVAWRGAVLLALVGAWFGFLWLVGLRATGLHVFVPVTWIAYALTNTFGRKLPGENPASGAMRRPRSR